MTTAPIDPNAFLMGGGSASARFDNPGDTITGTICEAPEVRQQTDISTGQPVHWPSGDPKMQLIVTLQTTLRDDPDDDGKRRIYVKGKSLTEAVREAVRQTGAKGLEIGGTLTVTYTGDGVASQRGFNPPKLYTATYARPDTAAQTGQFLGVQAQQAAPAASQVPAPAPAAGPTQAQIDALKAAGVDPKTVFPNYQGEPPF
jgi:hypothetical protein